MKRFITEFLAVLTLVVLVSGCGSTLKVTKLDDSGYFPTSKTITQNNVKAQEPFDAKYCSLLYVKTDERNVEYNQFFLQSFVNMNVFEVVLDKDGLENLVIEKGLTDKVTSVLDKIGLHNLQKQIGGVLVVEPYAVYEGVYNYSAELKAIDPETGKVVFHVTNKAFNWAGLDKPLFYPLFNAFLDWTQNRPIGAE